MCQRLTEDLVSQNLSSTFNALQKIGGSFKKGRLSDDECFRSMSAAFYKGYDHFLQEHSLVLRIDTSNYVAFTNQYYSYKAGCKSVVLPHVPWLYDFSDSLCEACSADQLQVLSLMNSFQITPDYYLPCPDTVISPKRTVCHRYHSSAICSIIYCCIEDGGLLSCANPVGQTFFLTSDLGLKSVVTIKEDRRGSDRRGLDFDERVTHTSEGVIVSKAEFLAEGFIEGYTTAKREGDPEILVRLKDANNIDWLAYKEYPADFKAFRAFPLWQDYFRWSDALISSRKQILSSLFDRFIQ